MKQLTEFLRRGNTSAALVDPSSGQTTNFEELHSAIDRCANRLRNRGLTPGDTVAGIFEPSRTFSFYYLASAKLGLDYLAVPPDCPEAHLNEIVHRNNIHNLILGVSRDVSADVITLIDTSQNPMYQNGHKHTMDDRSRNHSLLIRTSGTTGTSRVVELNWENLVESARASRERLGTRSDDLWFAPLPVHHIGGIAPLIRSLYNGTATAFESYSSEKLKRRLTEDPITVVSLVPTMLRDLVEAGLDGGQTQLRTVLVGGAPAEAQLVQSALERELPVHTTYGMTETASQIATARPSELRENPETVGKPLPNVTLEISGTDAGIRGNEKIGEIVVQGPMVAERYCHTDDQEPLNSPRFRTGDLGYLNEQNQLHVVGRKHRGILTGGELVHPVGIETTLNTLDSVEDSHVLGLPDDRLGEKIVSVLVARSEANLDPDSLYEILDKELMDHKIPEELYVVDKLPRTSSGTVDETKIRETLSGLNPYCSNYLGR